MHRTKSLIGLMTLLGLLLSVSPAWAKMENLKEFKNTYPEAGKATCGECHVKPFGGKELNPYGEAVKEQLTKTPALSDALKAVEPLDSDGDGVVNLDEIKAGTAPGDPASKPEAAR